MSKLICTFVLFCIIQLSSAAPSKRQSTLETAIFLPFDPILDLVLDPKIMGKYLHELQKISSSGAVDSFYWDIVDKLVELSTISGCDDDAFSKFDLLEEEGYTHNIRNFIRYQRIEMSKRCDRT